MNGPFFVSDYSATVCDQSGAAVARGDGVDEEAERKNAAMVCDALNSIFYAAKAAGAAS